MITGPCGKNCPDRYFDASDPGNVRSCKQTCKKWQEHEAKKKELYKKRVAYSDTSSAVKAIRTKGAKKCPKIFSS